MWILDLEKTKKRPVLEFTEPSVICCLFAEMKASLQYLAFIFFEYMYSQPSFLC